MNPNTGKIATLWQRFDSAVPVDYKNGERVYSVYSDYESDYTGDFNVLAGFDGASFPAEANLQKVAIPAAKYLVFKRKGDMPQIAMDAWTDVWSYFSQEAPEHQRLYTTDFEFYPYGDEIEVHIAIE